MQGRRGGTVIAALALSSSLGFAGGADAAAPEKPLSKKAYIKAADNICKQGDQLILQASATNFAGLGPNQDPTPAQLQAFVDDAGPIFQQEIDSLRALPAPLADVKKLKKFYKLVQQGFNKIVADPSILVTGSSHPLQKASDATKAYGFKVCGAVKRS